MTATIRTGYKEQKVFEKYDSVDSAYKGEFRHNNEKQCISPKHRINSREIKYPSKAKIVLLRI